jgi:hypothetical protein
VDRKADLRLLRTVDLKPRGIAACQPAFRHCGGARLSHIACIALVMAIASQLGLGAQRD